jgi:hypothetical protein
MIALGDSKEEVVGRLKEDVYSKNNVWDWAKAEIYPVSFSWERIMGDLEEADEWWL